MGSIRRLYNRELYDWELYDHAEIWEETFPGINGHHLPENYTGLSDEGECRD